jgi:hypothetical protein
MWARRVMDWRTQQRQNASPEFFLGEHNKISPILVGTVWFWVSSYESKSLKFWQCVSLPLSKTNYFCQVWLNQTFKRFHKIFFYRFPKEYYVKHVRCYVSINLLGLFSHRIFFLFIPVRIRVRMDHPHACRKRWSNWAGVTERSDSRRKLTPGSFFYVEMWPPESIFYGEKWLPFL